MDGNRMAYTARNELVLHISTRSRNNAGKDSYCGSCKPKRFFYDSGLAILDEQIAAEI